jgi:hypothetical protein
MSGRYYYIAILAMSLLSSYAHGQAGAFNIVDHQREVNARKINQELADIRQNFRSIDPMFFEAATRLRDLAHPSN